MKDTKDKLIQSLTFVGKFALYTGGLKIISKEEFRQGKVRTIYDHKFRKWHPVLFLVSIFGLATQGFNREVFKEIKDLYTVDSVWF